MHMSESLPKSLPEILSELGDEAEAAAKDLERRAAVASRLAKLAATFWPGAPDAAYSVLVGQLEEPHDAVYKLVEWMLKNPGLARTALPAIASWLPDQAELRRRQAEALRRLSRQCQSSGWPVGGTKGGTTLKRIQEGSALGRPEDVDALDRKALHRHLEECGLQGEQLREALARAEPLVMASTGAFNLVLARRIDEHKDTLPEFSGTLVNLAGASWIDPEPWSRVVDAAHAVVLTGAIVVDEVQRTDSKRKRPRKAAKKSRRPAATPNKTDLAELLVEAVVDYPHRTPRAWELKEVVNAIRDGHHLREVKDGRRKRHLEVESTLRWDKVRKKDGSIKKGYVGVVQVNGVTFGRSTLDRARKAVLERRSSRLKKTPKISRHSRLT